MEFKGTKGKWNACCTDKGKKSHYVFDGRVGTICAMLSNDPKDKDSDYDSMEDIVTVEQRQANAKLIAAAPELLEACKIAFSICDKLQMHTKFEIEELKVDLKTAIEKALK